MNYLLDSNTFIEAKNRYYGMQICPGYWDWLLHTNKTHDVSSINHVRNELTRGHDELATWAHKHSHFFVPEDDTPTQEVFGHIANHVMSLEHINSAARAEFLDGADPWLIAKAKATGAIIVTHEKFNKDAKRKIFIPNICKHFNVEYIDTFQLLHELKAEFVMKP